jgi:hypothetical protein
MMQRATNLENQLALTQELQQLNQRSDTSQEAAQRRTQIVNSLTLLEAENQTLRGASVAQIRAMGASGLLRPIDQREWAEGSGEGIAAGRINLGGVSAASINGRIATLRGAAEEARVATAQARAEAQAAAGARVEANARIDDGMQYDQFRQPNSSRPGGEWDWQRQAPNNGAVAGTTQTITVDKGALLDRYGSVNGTYLSPAGTSYEARALAPGSRSDGYSQYLVQKPFVVERSEVAPAFDQAGGGVQYRVVTPAGQSIRVNVDYLIKNGYLVKK